MLRNIDKTAENLQEQIIDIVVSFLGPAMPYKRSNQSHEQS